NCHVASGSAGNIKNACQEEDMMVGLMIGCVDPGGIEDRVAGRLLIERPLPPHIVPFRIRLADRAGFAWKDLWIELVGKSGGCKENAERETKQRKEMFHGSPPFVQTHNHVDGIASGAAE